MFFLHGIIQFSFLRMSQTKLVELLIIFVASRSYKNQFHPSNNHPEYRITLDDFMVFDWACPVVKYTTGRAIRHYKVVACYPSCNLI